MKQNSNLMQFMNMRESLTKDSTSDSSFVISKKRSKNLQNLEVSIHDKRYILTPSGRL